MSSIDAFLGFNVLLGFGWFVKTISIAMGQQISKLALMLGVGFVAALAIHILLATYFGSILQPVLWTFWNVVFVLSTAMAALVTLGIGAVSNRNTENKPGFEIRNEEI